MLRLQIISRIKATTATVFLKKLNFLCFFVINNFVGVLVTIVLKSIVVYWFYAKQAFLKLYT